MSTAIQRAAAIVAEDARQIATAEDYDGLIERAGQRQLVLIGEASHGTHDFYQTRAALTRRLIDEHEFRAVVCEADWPDSFRVHLYVTDRSDDVDATAALSDFRRFPAWMWRNRVTAEFIESLRKWNGRPGGERSQAGFYGMDLYSLHTSIESVLDYLERVIPRPRAGLVAGMLASSISAMSHRPMVPRPLTMARSRVRRKWSLNCSSSRANSRSSDSGTATSLPRNFSLLSKMRAW